MLIGSIEEVKAAKLNAVNAITRSEVDAEEQLLLIKSILDENKIYSFYFEGVRKSLGIEWFSSTGEDEKKLTSVLKVKLNAVLHRRNEVLKENYFDEEDIEKINPYVCVYRVVGTEPYLSSHLEMDIKDVYAYVIERYDDIESLDEILDIATTKEEVEEKLNGYVGGDF